LAEEVSRQHSIQAVALYCWVLLARFRVRIGSKKVEQNCKPFNFARKRASLKIQPNRVWLLKRFNPLKRSQVLCTGTTAKML
jgi:hypothetical protein